MLALVGVKSQKMQVAFTYHRNNLKLFGERGIATLFQKAR